MTKIKEDPRVFNKVEADPKRARNEKGHLVADDPSTPEVNEAWEGGKAPKAKAKGQNLVVKKAHQNPKGGLNAAGRAFFKRTTGANLKRPVKSGDNPRRASFLARMAGNPGPERDSKGRPTRLLLSLRAWGASSKADARKKAAAISKRNESRNA